MSQPSRTSGWKYFEDISNMSFLMNKLILYSDCPRITASFDIDGRRVTKNLEKILTRSIYPNGRCCRTIKPEAARKHPLYELSFKQTGYRMFLYDNRHFSILRQSFGEFKGEYLENEGTRHQAGGFEKYRVQFTEETHLEGDPSFEVNILTIFQTKYLQNIFSALTTPRPLTMTSAWRRNIWARLSASSTVLRPGWLTSRTSGVQPGSVCLTNRRTGLIFT